MYVLGWNYLRRPFFKSLLGAQIVVPEKLQFSSVYFPSFLFDGEQELRQSPQEGKKVEDCGCLGYPEDLVPGDKNLNISMLTFVAVSSETVSNIWMREFLGFTDSLSNELAYIKGLLELRILYTRRTKAESHLSS